MTTLPHDIWSQWFLHRRHGDDPQYLQTILETLAQVRDTVLDHAHLGEGETLHDVGCGDGLIALGALEQVPTSTVIFSDISSTLLQQVHQMTQDSGLLHRCQFLETTAEDLSALPEASVDVVTTRSVLIYIEAKAQALAEFYRVLKPQGRLSIYEPINRFASAPAPHLWRGYDVTPVQALAEKITAVYRRVTPEDTDPMLTFDERDMLHWVEQVGFTDIEMDYKAWIKPYARAPNHSSLVSEFPQVVARS